MAEYEKYVDDQGKEREGVPLAKDPGTPPRGVIEEVVNSAMELLTFGLCTVEVRPARGAYLDKEDGQVHTGRPV